MKVYSKFRRITVMWILIFSSFSAFSITTEDLKIAKPSDYFSRTIDSCSKNDQNLFFSNFSSEMRVIINSRMTSGGRDKLFILYCDAYISLVENKLQGDPNTATYTIVENRVSPKHRKRYSLCITPAGGKGCKIGFDVTIEGGQLKRDEL